MAGLFTGGGTGSENYNVKGGQITKVNNANKLPGLSSITSNAQSPQQGVSPLYDVGKTASRATPYTGSGLQLSNTGNTANIPTNMYGMITAKPGAKLNEAEVTANASLASAYGQAAINRPDQYTPYGSSTWSTDPETGQATNRVTLDPAQQELLDSQTRMQTGLAGVGSGLVDQVREQYSTPLDFSGAPQVQNGTTTKGVARPDLQTSIRPYGSIQDDLNYNGNIQDRVASAGGIQRQVDTSGINPLTYSANKGNIQNNIDMSGVPSLVGGQDLLGFQAQARDAAWNNAKAALDPQWNSYETGLETKLANQGVMQGSDAWNKAVSEMSRNRQYDYSQAQNNAVSQGLTAAQQLYGQGLSSNQNAYNQALGRGNFTNAAQAQDFGQNYQNATLGNQASMDTFNARRAVMSDANDAQQQQYGQNANDMSQANAAQNQGYTQASNNMQLHNASQEQGFGQNKANAEFGNASALSSFGLDMANAELNNSGINQDFSNSTNMRNQYINELMTQRNAPLSALTSIMSGTQPSMPDFSSTNVVGGINSPDTMSGLAATKQANAAQTAAKYQAAGNIISSATKMINPIKIPGFS